MVAEAALITVAIIGTEGFDASVLFVFFQEEGGVVDVGLGNGITEGWADKNMVDATNPGVTDPTQFDYTAPLVMLACLGVAALLLGFVLKAVDKKKGLGLEEPNIKE